MNDTDIRNIVLTNLAAQGIRYVPVGVSARHVHLCRQDLSRLFGPGYALSPFRPLTQPGQFASEERVTVSGPGGSLADVRVLGPVRGFTQIEMAFSDLLRLGIEGQIRLSGSVEGTPGCILKGPAGEIAVSRGVIAAARHLHLSDAQAACYGLKNGEIVSVRADGPRAAVLEQVVCQVGKGNELELHLDTDEANAVHVRTGDILEISAPCGPEPIPGVRRPGGEKAASCEETEPMDVITERDVTDAFRGGKKVIRCQSRAIVTDAAWDRARSLSIEIRK